MTLPRDRLAYSSPFTRPPLKLPGNGRMIVRTDVNVEDGRSPGQSRGSSRAADGRDADPRSAELELVRLRNAGRVLAADARARRAGVVPTMSINAKVCETYLEVAGAARDAGWEFMAHSYVQMPIQQIEDQRAVIRQSIEIIERFTGKRPTGWLGPGRMQTFHTLDYVTEHGLSWFGDWVLDDQPLWVKTAHGPILSVPYSAEINDITMMVSHHHESDVLMKRTADAFDRLYEESAESARILGDRGAPLRDRRRPPHQIFRGALRLHQQARGSRALDGQEIHDWYYKVVPPPA